MKYVFSRKGFDSSAGGYPSLIFPDGSLFSIPIPSTKDKYLYRDLAFKHEKDSIQRILNELTDRNIYCGNRWRRCDYEDNEQYCHYDPMPISGSHFKGLAIGQANAAEGHLRKQGISEGDVFLFYGWFREIEKHDDRWRYVRGAQDLHLIWSYLVVGATVGLDTIEQQDRALNNYPDLINHPHVGGHKSGKKNRVYLSSEHKYFGFQRERCLTDLENYRGRATWRLPACFHQPDAFTYLNNFTLDGDHTIVSYRGYGQEFVLDLDKVKSESEKHMIDEYIGSLIQ